ncbi:MAG: nucleotidyl transferase AbiEii/AbiGii toxin family protein [Cyclobacteriaceae bacterium]|nr:nucleotidyl transferase AbiEii/AbiGii toxin family protein [Cyclobacteriaceae bacterium]
MPNRLYWNTVTPLLRIALMKMMEEEPFQQFRLVGGTSLSLQLGHRSSIDIDLFTDAAYEAIDFGAIDKFLRDSFNYVSEPNSGVIGIGQSYLIGESEDEAVKLDLYYTDPFIQPQLVIDSIRFATVEEIIAMKIDIVQRVARKKDFWDLHELLEKYSIDKMIELHKTRYSYNHEKELIRTNFTNFTMADQDFDPICLKGKYWELIKYDFVQALKKS